MGDANVSRAVYNRHIYYLDFEAAEQSEVRPNSARC